MRISRCTFRKSLISLFLYFLWKLYNVHSIFTSFFSRHSFFRIFFIANVLPSFVLWRKRAKNTFMSFHPYRMFDVMIARIFESFTFSYPTEMIYLSYLTFSIFSTNKLFLYYSIFIAFHCSYKALICQIIFISLSCQKCDLSFLLTIPSRFIKLYN